MSVIAIMQPSYLPWSGYFNLMAQANTFVFLDDVKFEKSSWHTRNRILINDEPNYLSVPTQGSRYQTIQEVLLSPDMRWKKKHLASISQNYAKTPYSQDVIALLTPIFNDNSITHLADLTMAIILAFAKALNLQHKTIRSSTLATQGARSEKIIQLIHALNGNHYISPIGAKDYIEEDALLPNKSIKLSYQNFNAAAYSQTGSKVFSSHLSIVDVVANLGWHKSKQYILNGWQL